MEKFKSFDVDRWSTPDEHHHVKQIGMAKAIDIFNQLRDHLKNRNMLPDEYFLYSGDEDSDKELPNYDFALCIPNFGDSEGVYLDIVLVYRENEHNNQRHYMNFATGKTLSEGVDSFLKMSKIGAECSLLLNGRGSCYKKEAAEITLNPKEIYTLNHLIDERCSQSLDIQEKRLLTGVQKQLFCMANIPIMAISRHDQNIFSLWIHDMSDIMLRHLIETGVLKHDSLEKLLDIIPICDENNLYILRKEGVGVYYLYICPIEKCYYSVHEQQGLFLFGTKTELCNEIRLRDTHPFD